VICLAPVFFVFIGLRAASDQFVSPGIAGNLARDIGLGDDGGNAVLLIDGPVSELGDLCCKNWTTAVVSFYLAGRRQCSMYSLNARAYVVCFRSHVSPPFIINTVKEVSIKIIKQNHVML